MRKLLAAGLATGITLLVALPGAAIASVSPAAAHSRTFSGPHMYDPATGGTYATAATVTVTQDTDLANQMIEVSWTGFTPSDTVIYSASDTDYPVMVAECDTADPTNPDQCYDATNAGSTETEGQYGPSNTAYAITESNGTGSADIELYTGTQNQFLGCGSRHKCSLVVMPAQGGNSLDTPPDCSDHSQDNQALDTGQYEFIPLSGSPNSYCSWIKRIVIPLSFAPSDADCPLRTGDFTAGGSPMLADAMEQWEAGLCQGSSPLTVQYNASNNEYEARQDFADGLDDVAFTTQPIASGTTTKHPYTYAPVAVSAASVAYWLDNTQTGQPYTNLKLDARLLAKLLTTSYAYTDDGCPSAQSGSTCDNAVDGNPSSLFSDPEFEELNPAIKYPADPDGFQVPTVESGQSDMTWTVTSWIAADKEAAGFLSGTFDQWGMHVNTSYLGLSYPTDQFTTQDPFLAVSMRYSPVYPLAKVAWYQALNWEPGTEDTIDPATNNYDSLPELAVGQRDLFAVLDEADAAQFAFPVAALENHAGKYVEPTAASMRAALNDMTVNSDGITESFNQGSDDPSAYPLTMIIYAVVPTGGISQTKAAKIAQFLDYVADEGQQPGTAAGDLASGYLPLTAKLRAQTLKAAQEVLDQTGNTSTKTASSSPSASPAASRSTTPAAAPSPASTPSAQQIAVAFNRPDTAGLSWVVLAVLIGGLVFGVGGPATLIYASPGARSAIRGAIRRVRHPRIPLIKRNKS